MNDTDMVNPRPGSARARRLRLRPDPGDVQTGKLIVSLAAVAAMSTRD
ncbi:hypothetical protein KL953_04805 [Mycolicibacterium goodii]|nr:hypothetical protein [Mycolicibacterium goodii]MBU8808206.1 hypothetical protein [Mycolicibacterium goodii]